MKQNKTKIYIFGIVILAALIAVDQYTKYLARTYFVEPVDIIKNVLQFKYIYNEGAAWSILSGKQMFFIIITIVLMAVILFVYFKTPADKKYRALRIDLVVLAAGALGNFIDRVSKQKVDDFIYLKFINFPIFNFADMCVTLSMIFLIILILFRYKDHDFDYLKWKKKEAGQEQPDE